MTEPDWTTAPSWAQWFTIDDDGTGWWWKTKPKLTKMIGSWAVDKSHWWEIQPAGVYLKSSDGWEQSLRQRPTKGEKHDRS